jgi:galactokinase
MGGIADYSGSLVLQRTIAEATFAALQVIDEPAIHLVSLGRAPYSIPLEALGYDEARAFFQRLPENHWVSYVIGLFLVHARERTHVFRRREDCGLI